MLMLLLSIFCGYDLPPPPRWVNLGRWEPVPPDYKPADLGDFPAGHIDAPAPAKANSEMGGQTP